MSRRLLAVRVPICRSAVCVVHQPERGDSLSPIITHALEFTVLILILSLLQYCFLIGVIYCCWNQRDYITYNPQTRCTESLEGGGVRLESVNYTLFTPTYIWFGMTGTHGNVNQY